MFRPLRFDLPDREFTAYSSAPSCHSSPACGRRSKALKWACSDISLWSLAPCSSPVCCIIAEQSLSLSPRDPWPGTALQPGLMLGLSKFSQTSNLLLWGVLRCIRFTLVAKWQCSVLHKAIQCFRDRIDRLIFAIVVECSTEQCMFNTLFTLPLRFRGARQLSL